MNPLVPLRCDIMGRYSVSCVFRESSVAVDPRPFYEIYVWAVMEDGTLGGLVDQGGGSGVLGVALADFLDMVRYYTRELEGEIRREEEKRITEWSK